MSMMVTKISSKSELVALASKLNTQLVQLGSEIDAIKKVLSSVTDYDGINLSSGANILSNNLTAVYEGLKIVSLNIKNYAEDLAKFDVYDLNIDEEMTGNPSQGEG